jgi:hypothetical protein
VIFFLKPTLFSLRVGEALNELSLCRKTIVMDKRFFGTKEEAPLMLTCERKKHIVWEMKAYFYMTYYFWTKARKEHG